MEQIECSETSANHNRTPGKYPKEYIQDSKHGESLKSRVEFGNETNDRHKVKVKVKCTLVQALRLCTGRTVHRESRGIALLFLDHGTRRGEKSATRLGRTLPPGKTRYPLYRRLGGPHGQSGQVRKISSPPGFNPRTVQPVASRYTD